MHEQYDSQDTGYLSELGLRYPPFVGAPDDSRYFDATTRRNALNLALYLARYSDLVLLVHGPAGSGKSTFLRAMIERSGQNIHAVSITATPATSAAALCEALLHSFKPMTTEETIVQQILQIKEQLDNLQRKGYHCILFVDDADRLPRDAFALLETLADLRNESSRNLVNVALFAQQPDRIAFTGPSVPHRIKLVELHAFDADEVAPYLQHRLAVAGGTSLYEQVFRERDIRRVTRESRAMPGAINALATQRLSRYVARKHPESAPLEQQSFAKKQIAIATLVTGAMAAAFVFQDEINRVFNETATAMQSTAATRHAPLQTPPEPLVAAIEPQSLSSEPPSIESESAVLDLPVTETGVKPEAQILDAPAPVASIATAPVAPTPVAAVDETAATPETSGENAHVQPQQEDWLLTQKPEAFTLQVAGSSEKGDIRRALKKYEFNEVTAIYSTQKKGKPWFGLVTGVYTDLTAAQQARAALPEELSRGVWVRRIRAIQKDISKQPDQATPEETTDTAAGPTPATVD